MTSEFSDALKSLMDKVESVSISDVHAAGVVRVETAFPAVDLLAWLGGQSNASRLYWADREGGFAAAGIGAARVYTGTHTPDLTMLFGEMEKICSPERPGLRFYGGFPFKDSDKVSAAWESFGTHYFVLPVLEIGRRDGQYFGACNLVAGTDESRFEAVELLRAAGTTPDNGRDLRITSPVSRTDRPDCVQWEEMVKDVLSEVHRGVIDKAVLARESLFIFEHPVDPVALLSELVEHTTFSFHFCFQTKQGTAFIGASPERLYRRQGRRLSSEAIAGTRSRGMNAEQDKALGCDLLECDKDRREHAFVQDALRGQFDEACESTQGDDEVRLLVLRQCQHLMSRIEGRLRQNYGDAELMRMLHPTPAVGGVPTEEALRLIDELEPFSRGWYAGPIGWVGHDAAEFAVAIRSGLVHDMSLALYTGAGVVSGSDPQEEWAEIENKMANFLDILRGVAEAVEGENPG